MSDRAVQVVAEIGCNHKGSFEIALELIRVAATICNADVAKFQKRHNRELLSPEQYDAPHPVPDNAYGPTYGAHREFLEFDTEQHRERREVCEAGKAERLQVLYEEIQRLEGES